MFTGNLSFSPYLSLSLYITICIFVWYRIFLWNCEPFISSIPRAFWGLCTLPRSAMAMVGCGHGCCLQTWSLWGCSNGTTRRLPQRSRRCYAAMPFPPPKTSMAMEHHFFFRRYIFKWLVFHCRVQFRRCKGVDGDETSNEKHDDDTSLNQSVPWIPVFCRIAAAKWKCIKWDFWIYRLSMKWINIYIYVCVCGCICISFCSRFNVWVLEWCTA